MTTFRTLAATTLAAVTALGLSACANNSTPAASGTAAPAGSASASAKSNVALVNPGKLTVCTHLAFKPFQFKDASGKIVGFDVDLMDLVAKDLGVTQEIVDIEFGQITSGAVFAAKKCDAGAAGITITDARKQSATFADPYFDSKQALLVKADSGITGLEQLKGKTLSIQTDTSGADYAKANEAKHGYTTRVFDDLPSMANAVVGGTAQGAINDNGVLFDFAKENPTTKVVAEYDTGEKYGFNVGNDNKQLAEKINAVMKKAKADGTFNTLYKKWFGVDAPK